MLRIIIYIIIPLWLFELNYSKRVIWPRFILRKSNSIIKNQ